MGVHVYLGAILFVMTSSALSQRLLGGGSHGGRRGTSKVAGLAPGEVCVDHPGADVVFVLDASSSIRGGDFRRQLDFVQGVISFFNVSRTHTQVGAMSFSNWAYLEFHVAAHGSMAAVQRAVATVGQAKGDTNTADALAYVTDVMFQPHNGARPGLPHIAVVLTDGKSNEPAHTAREAARARARGINVFTIGIGSEVDRGELEAIAGRPEYVFQVGDFTALQYIRQILAQTACEVPPPPPTPAPTEPAPVCFWQSGGLADLVLAPSPAGSADNTEKTLAFFRELTQTLDVDSGNVRVALVPKDCSEPPPSSLDRLSHAEVLARLDRMIDNLPDTAQQLKYMRRKSFSVQSGARPGARGVAVLVADGEDELGGRRAKAQATRLHRQGVTVFVIAVGDNVKRRQVASLASSPAASHLFHVTSYDELPAIMYRVREAVCQPPKDSDTETS